MTRTRLLALATSALLVLGGLLAPTGSASAGPPPTVSQPQPQAEVAPASGGWNDWTCSPSADKPRPLVLLHGLGGQRFTNWFYQAPRLASEGYCVFSFTYGEGVGGELIAGLGPIRESAAETSDFVEEVLAATGAEEVDLVGHSQGTVVAAWYVKELGGADRVENLVGFGSVFDGTSLLGLSRLIDRILPLVPDKERFIREVCDSCLDLLEGSDFIEELNAGGLTVPGVEYTSIITRLDTVVTPYTNGAVEGPGATTIELQEVCPLDLSGHVALVISPNVTTLIQRATDPAAAERPMRCRIALPIPLSEQEAAAQGTTLQDGTG